MTREEWRPVPGFPGYRVSDCGNVRSGKAALKAVNQRGYRAVALYRDRKRHTKGIHALMMLAFIGPPPSPGHVVNHIDMNRANNVLSNLEYCTRGANISVAYAIRNGTAPPGTRAARESRPCGRCPGLIWDTYGVREINGAEVEVCVKCADELPVTTVYAA